MAKKKKDDALKSTKDTPAAFLTFDELLIELQGRCRKMVFIAVVDDREDGGVKTLVRRTETCGDAILLLNHGIQFCEANWNFNTFGPEDIDDDGEELEEVG